MTFSFDPFIIQDDIIKLIYVDIFCFLCICYQFCCFTIDKELAFHAKVMEDKAVLKVSL